MNKYKIRIREILQTTEEIEASSPEEALRLIEDKYDKCEIVLDAGDIKETLFDEVTENEV